MTSSRTTASALHRFNRYEIKYLVAESRLTELHAQIERRMQRDPHQQRPTRVSSLYYDTRDLRFYWEKIDGLRFRRKLRIRIYGAPETVSDDSTVYVEIKQRVNRVTQKRRIALPYPAARRLCDDRTPPPVPDSAKGLVEEILTLTHNYDLQPSAITTYFRGGFIGTEGDLGLRITTDHRVCGRDRDFYLGAPATNVFVIPPHLSIVEVKANERVPTWFTDIAARLNLETVRISKYCKAIEAHHHGARATQHVRARPAPLSTR